MIEWSSLYHYFNISNGKEIVEIVTYYMAIGKVRGPPITSWCTRCRIACAWSESKLREENKSFIGFMRPWPAKRARHVLDHQMSCWNSIKSQVITMLTNRPEIQ